MWVNLVTVVNHTPPARHGNHETASVGSCLVFHSIPTTLGTVTGRVPMNHVWFCPHRIEVCRVYAVGSYNGTAVIYDECTHESLLELPCQSNGVTQVKFSANGAYLFVAGRQSNDILCWDVRMTRSVVSTLKRRGNTNQRIEFDVEPLGRHLITGSVDSAAIVYDLNTASEVTSVEGFSDAVNGVSVHPLGTCVAFTTGQRHFPLPRVCDDSDDDSPSGVEPTPRPFPELSIWKCEMG